MGRKIIKTRRGKLYLDDGTWLCIPTLVMFRSSNFVGIDYDDPQEMTLQEAAEAGVKDGKRRLYNEAVKLLIEMK